MKANPKEDGEKPFARMLSDVENKSDTFNQKAGLAEPASPPGERREYLNPPSPALTNLGSDEVPPPSTAPESVPIISAKNIVSMNDSLYQSVKFSPGPVNFLAPETVSSLVPSGSAPVVKPPGVPRFAEIRREPSAGIEDKAARAELPAALATEKTASVSFQKRPAAPEFMGVERTVDNETGNAVASRPRHGKEAIKDIISTAGKFYGIDPNLSMAIAQTESSFQPTAVSRDGHASKGIFQLLDSTGKDMLGHTGLDEHYDPFDPAQNAYLGVGYLRRLHDIFSVETKLSGRTSTIPAGSAQHLEKLAVAAFNAGEGSVARAQAKAKSLGKDPSDYSSVEPYLPASTRLYVQKVSEIRTALADAETDNELA